MDIAEDYLQRILKVLIYVEEHIDEELTLEELSKIACYSPFHFHRVFQTIVGENLAQYIKRLRMERAASKLWYSEQPITNIALDANFETPSAFTRAFKQFTGKSPKNYRLFHSEANAIINQKLKELQMITPDKIEKIPDINLLFVRRMGSYLTTPADAWRVLDSFVSENKLDPQTTRQFGISHDDPGVTNEEKLRYDACIAAPQEIKGRGEIGRSLIKGGKYAIFTHNGPYPMIKDAFDRIFMKWLPQSGDQFDEARPCFCEYFKREYVKTDQTKLVTKIYIPLK